MFTGPSKVSVDAKGRMSVPKKYRDALTKEPNLGRVVVTLSPQAPCLFLYPYPVWFEIAERIDKLPSIDAHTAHLQRILCGSADDTEMDSTGRVRLADNNCERVGISKRIVLLGMGKKFEIWDEDRWHDLYTDSLEKGMPEAVPSPELDQVAW